MNLTYDEFRDTVVEQIKDHLPGKYADSTVTVSRVMKNNDTQLDVLTITAEARNATPAIYLNQFYGMYLDGASMDFILEKIVSLCMENDFGINYDLSRILNFDQVKDHIIARIVNAETNRENLDARPHTNFEDLAVTYHIDLGQSGDGWLTSAVTNELMKTFGISVEELHEVAMENTLRSRNIIFNTLEDTRTELMTSEMNLKYGFNQEEVDIFTPNSLPAIEFPMYVMTNEDRAFGAIYMINKEIMDIITNEIGGDVYVLPSSVHDVIIVPVETGVQLADLEDMVQDVNQTEVSPEDFLSDHVYYYDARKHELTRCR